MRYLVTGASSGIGRATAEALAKLEHSVVAVARSLDKLEALQARYAEQVQIVVADLSTSAGIASVVDALDLKSPLHGIVHAAGSLIEPTDYNDLHTEQLLSDTQVHVAAPIALNNALNKTLAEGLNGTRIVYIDSNSASRVRVGWGAYSIVKAAAQMAAKLAAEEISQATVIRVFPGAVRTPLVETVLNWDKPSPVVDTFSELDAAGEMSEPVEIGEYIAGILCKASDRQLAEREFWDFSRADDRVF